MQFYSQPGSCYSQDSYLKTNVFKNFRNGFFVDVGAHDGKTINNTLFFEETDGWTGINVEPIQSVYNNLITNRPKCININAAIDIEDGYAEFATNEGYTEMLSGLQKYYDPRHKDRIQREIAQRGGQSKTVIVRTRSLESIFDEYHVKQINYLSIDTEGAEFAVIRSINFDKVFIDVIGFENNYPDESPKIVDYLVLKGFKYLRGGSDIFMIHKDSRFIV